MIGFVPQQATLFGGTIRENMQWGHPHATDEEIYEALELSQSKEFVDKMTEGLDTYIEQVVRMYLVDKDKDSLLPVP